MNTGDISITMETLRKRRFTVAGWSLTLGGRDHKTATTTAFVNKKPKWKEKTENDKHDVCACIWSKQIARLMCICVSVCVYTACTCMRANRHFTHWISFKRISNDLCIMGHKWNQRYGTQSDSDLRSVDALDEREKQINERTDLPVVLRSPYIQATDINQR